MQGGAESPLRKLQNAARGPRVPAQASVAHRLQAAKQNIGSGVVVIKLPDKGLIRVTAGRLNAVIIRPALPLHTRGGGLLPTLAGDRGLGRVDVGKGLRADHRRAGTVYGDDVARKVRGVKVAVAIDRKRLAESKGDKRCSAHRSLP